MPGGYTAIPLPDGHAAEIERLWDEREDACIRRDYKRADEIKRELEERFYLNVNMRDRIEGGPLR